MIPTAPQADAIEAPTPATSSPARKADRFAQGLLLTLLFAVPALMVVYSGCIQDPDLWWHLRTGQWIVQHHAIPHVDTFSRFSVGKPWEAYSWLYELLVYGLFSKLGLAGIVIYTAGMLLAILVALRHLIQRMQTDFSQVALLTFAACFSMSHLFTPRPWLFTILFFVVELDILMHARRTGRTRELLWLPVIFALWSNLHIQFIYGLAALGLAAVEALAVRWIPSPRTRLRAPWLCEAFVASALAAMANPFGWGIYRVVYNLAKEPGGLDKISELQAIPFRNLPDFCILLLALGAVAALAWHRRMQMFEIGLLAFGVYASFRSQRDAWVIVVAAIAVLASTLPGRAGATRLPSAKTAWLATAAAAVIMLSGIRIMGMTNAQLQGKLEKFMPVAAVRHIQAKGYAGPLYNDFNWGGYLVWSQRMPVSIDGRGAFYGDQAIDRSVATWGAAPDWASDPELASAGVVLGPVKSPLIQVLRMDPKFRLVFEDKVAAVFVAQK